jgi:predicted anti-sigma-YlaC factor YlaD
MADPQGPDPDDLQCRELVDTLTEYLDGTVSERQRMHIEQHLEGCEGCRVALDQFRTVIRLAGRLTPADVARIDELVRDRLLATLRVMRRR